MSDNLPDKNQVLDAIRKCADQLWHPPSRSEFKTGKIAPHIEIQSTSVAFGMNRSMNKEWYFYSEWLPKNWVTW